VKICFFKGHDRHIVLIGANHIFIDISEELLEKHPGLLSFIQKCSSGGHQPMIPENHDDYIKYRFHRAEESFEEAMILYVINRDRVH
jgi:type II secretory pathway predicted ATPase ExeA